ncbi:tripartite tricarboxylate transporter substrate binding protein [Candidimonas sp. SYP-B2681]|uniref:Bug family tripartite tricarboxylate transporter substrate binding protein n=1 Tax=Candidimonas sp. SYP-B2681 TaxID=2497686 RepID=UPI000F87846A|nr:tripartite tricarboxylate transporter substrate binding protein [Candidimonas sp. SYP-B2681]RTZ39230.1 tripartite tricarboxylate transporter substrate binding protein [Candidimonas sp. SYP-B2681]
MFNKLIVGGIAALTLSASVFAAYPDRPVTIMVPFPAGQTGDIIARTVGEQLTKKLGQSFIVENRGGAGGRIGTGFAARGKNDGYTLLLTSTGPFAIAPSLYSTLNYDPLNDFEPVADIAATPQILAVSKESGINNVEGLLKKARSEDISYASAGNGSTQHLTVELIKQELKVPMVHIPFKGSSESKTQVMSGLIPFTSDSLPAILPQIKSGQLKPIAVVDLERSEYLPDVPTLAELGYPKFSTVAFFGLMAPKGTPKEVVDTLNKNVIEILNSPETTKRFEELALTRAKERTPEEFREYLTSEVAKWKKVIDDADAKIE